MQVKIIVHVPLDSADKVREAIGDTGAGTVGEYTHCSFSSVGTGRFVPSADANPHIGKTGQLEEVEEVSIEVVCERDTAKIALEAIRKAHPYEEVGFEIIPLLDESDL